MNRMDALIAQRRRSRHAMASTAAAAFVAAARDHGIAVTLVGSLARGDFGSHSDVDVLVDGPQDRQARCLLERLAAGCFRQPGLDYDLIFAEDLTADRVQEFLHDAV
ncbi:nucleotidyltransferase domain-containing protein [Rhizobium sp. SG2393]|uniref:nucleotidyltransferase domain-containing protein n=1 Tax=Rhizobium sp. SG2393 TaxID=3276279 RepID=UPI00367044D6